MAEELASVEQRIHQHSLNTNRVPVLPSGALYLFEALNDENLGFREIASAIEKVPSVAARLLALANSAWSSPASPVLSLDLACSRLGMQIVRTTSLAIAASQPFNPTRCPAFDGRTYWTSALLNADTAARLAQYAAVEQESVARTTGLLINLGLVWLAEELPARTAEALLSANEGPRGAINQALVDNCGLGYDEAGAILTEAWGLPLPLHEAVAGQFSGCEKASPLCSIVSTASRMVAAATREAPWETPDRQLEDLGVTPATQQAVFEQVIASKAATRELADALFG